MDVDLFRAALGRLPGLHGTSVLNAVRQVGSLATLATLPPRDLVGLGWPPGVPQALRALDTTRLAQDLAFSERSGARLIAAAESEYPAALLQLSDAPPLLYVRGDPQILTLPQLAIVGSRNATGAGRAIAREFGEYFTRFGLAITSGLAAGIDGAAHDGALAGGGRTIAVCGTGLDVIFPAAHRDLAERIAAHGALVSEFPPGTPPRRANFPQRNRVIAALSLGTLVVEAGVRSGALTTARHAADLGREVFAIPGSIHNPLARGCHRLIRSGAKLVECGEDVLAELKISLQHQLLEAVQAEARPGAAQREALDKDYEILLHALGFAPASADQLVARTGLSSAAVASMLLMLELRGDIELQPGGRYARVAR
ncbi:MAG: DNA-processing protein DprA [Steroidobacteraceae bacterium]|nr:DNA-processing protein DprA [Steroidobacteraceae bacterium]MDW8260791.1 DNA-processing protein DprA [Gammaproteobacteria bacterium]